MACAPIPCSETNFHHHKFPSHSPIAYEPQQPRRRIQLCPCKCCTAFHELYQFKSNTAAAAATVFFSVCCLSAAAVCFARASVSFYFFSIRGIGAETLIELKPPSGLRACANGATRAPHMRVRACLVIFPPCGSLARSEWKIRNALNGDRERSISRPECVSRNGHSERDSICLRELFINSKGRIFIAGLGVTQSERY